MKAIKIIFGFHDENRAQRELKSLNRIKEVRHPFLLSLERIDVVDGRLVVVTELAEQSLMERFVRVIQKGDSGIGRKELLGYLSDAADALDYLSEEHNLQHLDIKPENLLLVGGHVKVADFGLVKDVQDASQSMMSGLTPNYAPPELFDGCPCKKSDQYSLAIVFQEMLTGTRPFVGQTAAQLAAQHLTSSPDLSPLPPADQSVLKRALAKSPDVRYESCREFVEALKRTKRTRVARSTSTCNTTAISQSTLSVESKELVAMAAKLGEQKLPPVETSRFSGTFAPSLVIGIGETATSIVGELKRRVRRRVGASEKTPAIRFLCVDTDEQSLKAAAAGNDSGTLSSDELLATPLRPAAEYRDRKDLDLRWISRRWIYNIPKNLQTQCLRPLGRLAFVDHHDAILGRIQHVVEQMTTTGSVSTTAAEVGMRAEDGCRVRVFVVASISGGVGSGMVNDMAYAVRTIMDEHAIDAAEVIGLLVFSAGRNGSPRDVTTANAYACLNEMHHYDTSAQGYPGDPACDLPGFTDRPTFDHTYLIDMGQDPLPDEYDAAADEIAEYLYLNVATPCGDYFDSLRDADGGDDQIRLRSIGIRRSCGPGNDVIGAGADQIARQLLVSWLSPLANPLPIEPRDVVADAFRRLELVAETLGDRCGREIEHRVQRNFEHDVMQVCLELRPQLRTVLETDGGEALRNLVESRLTGVIGGGLSTLPVDVKLHVVVDDLLRELSSAMTSELFRLILGYLDETPNRLWFAQEMLRIVLDRLSQLTARLGERSSAIKTQLVQSMSVIAAPVEGVHSMCSATEDERIEALDQIGRLSLERFRNGFAISLVEGLCRDLNERGKTIDDVAQCVQSLAQRLHTRLERRPPVQNRVRNTEVLSNAMASETSRMTTELATKLNQRLQANFFYPDGGFRNIESHTIPEWSERFEELLAIESRRVISDLLCNADFQRGMMAGIDSDSLREWAKESVQLAKPFLLKSCGGRSRLTIATPRVSGPAVTIGETEEIDGHLAQTIPSTGGDVVYCCEVAGVAVTQAAAVMLHNCPEAGELVERVYVRSDVQWTPLLRSSN